MKYKILIYQSKSGIDWVQMLLKSRAILCFDTILFLTPMLFGYVILAIMFPLSFYFLIKTLVWKNVCQGLDDNEKIFELVF